LFDAYVFVAVLGASSYTYAEATWTRGVIIKACLRWQFLACGSAQL
jgi:transposase